MTPASFLATPASSSSHSPRAVDQTEPADPYKLPFFKSVNALPNCNGVAAADAAKGLASGTYRLFSINAAANHHPVLASVAQYSIMDNCICFIVV